MVIKNILSVPCSGLIFFMLIWCEDNVLRKINSVPYSGLIFLS